MGRESHEYPTKVVHSSIALLQERFKELQRVKEMREERELLGMLAEPNNGIYKQFNTNNFIFQPQYYEPAKLFLYHHDLKIQQRSTPQVSLSLWPTLQGSFEEQYYNCSSFNEITHLLMKSWPKVEYTPSFEVEAFMNKSQDSVDHESDVDTSLHL